MQVLAFFAQRAPCLIGMEACGGAHYWARKLQAQGHTVKLMAPQFVKPYVKANKADAADAEAICEAVTRPSMRFVPIKHAEQQAILSLHRARQGFVRARTAQANQIRGLLSEYGITLPQGIHHVAKRLPEIIEDAEHDLPGLFRVGTWTRLQCGIQIGGIVDTVPRRFLRSCSLEQPKRHSCAVYPTIQSTNGP